MYVVTICTFLNEAHWKSSMDPRMGDITRSAVCRTIAAGARPEGGLFLDAAEFLFAIEGSNTCCFFFDFSISQGPHLWREGDDLNFDSGV